LSSSKSHNSIFIRLTEFSIGTEHSVVDEEMEYRKIRARQIPRRLKEKQNVFWDYVETQRHFG
jgi:hypothetical protein